MTTHHIHLLLERRYAEVMYFGMLRAMTDDAAESRLILGLACCALSDGTACNQRMFERAEQPERRREPQGTFGTYLVVDGFEHVATAIRAEPLLSIPNELHPLVREIIEDLELYHRAEMHGPSGIARFHRKTAALAAAILLRRLVGEPANTTETPQSRAANKAIEVALASAPSTTSAYEIAISSVKQRT